MKRKGNYLNPDLTRVGLKILSLISILVYWYIHFGC